MSRVATALTEPSEGGAQAIAFLIDACHLAAQRGQVVHPVDGEDDRRATRRQPGQDPVHVPGAGRVEAVRRLVEHQQPGPGQQRGGKPETLPHPEREAAHAVVRDVGEPDLVQRVGDAVVDVAAQAGQRGEVLPSREGRIQPRPRTQRIVSRLTRRGLLRSSIRSGVGYAQGLGRLRRHGEVSAAPAL
jgi:hypothetical protein